MAVSFQIPTQNTVRMLLWIPTRHTWSEWLYFEANEIVGTEQVPVSCKDLLVHSLTHVRLWWSARSDFFLQKLFNVCNFNWPCNHVEAKCSVIAERFHFHKREQAAKDTTADLMQLWGTWRPIVMARGVWSIATREAKATALSRPRRYMCEVLVMYSLCKYICSLIFDLLFSAYIAETLTQKYWI